MGVDPDEDEYASDDEPAAMDHTNFWDAENDDVDPTCSNC